MMNGELWFNYKIPAACILEGTFGTGHPDGGGIRLERIHKFRNAVTDASHEWHRWLGFEPDGTIQWLTVWTPQPVTNWPNKSAMVVDFLAAVRG